MQITLYGDVPQDENSLIFSNHQCDVDWLTILAALRPANCDGRCSFMLKVSSHAPCWSRRTIQHVPTRAPVQCASVTDRQTHTHTLTPSLTPSLTTASHHCPWAHLLPASAQNTLKYVPIFGWFWWMSGFVYIRKSWAKDQERIRRKLKRMADSKQKVSNRK